MDYTTSLLRELSEAPGLPGYEHEVRKIMRRHLTPLAEVRQDNLGSIIAEKRGSEESPRIMLAAHMDEIGYMVTSIDKNGFLRFQTLGGWWEQVMLAQRVEVRTSQGSIPGVVGSKPPHIISDNEHKKMVEKRDMFIDIGAGSSEQAAAWGVRPGDPIVPWSPFVTMRDDKMVMGKAWDDRAGCAIIIETMRSLQNRNHPNTLFGVGTVQEEVGLRGAVTSSFDIRPDVGIVLEVAIPGDTPGIKENEAHSKLKSGPAVLIYDSSMIPNTRLRDMVIDIARKKSIPVQFDIMPGGGTDAGRIHITGKGVPSIVLGVPCRYVHSHTGIMHLDDYQNSLRLVVELIASLDRAAVSSFCELERGLYAADTGFDQTRRNPALPVGGNNLAIRKKGAQAGGPEDDRGKPRKSKGTV